MQSAVDDQEIFDGSILREIDSGKILSQKPQLVESARSTSNFLDTLLP